LPIQITAYNYNMKINSTNPSCNYEIIGEVEATTERELEDDVAKARNAQPAWAALTQIERNNAIESFIAICKVHDKEIAELISSEMGMPIARSSAQVAEAFDYFRAYMDMAERALAPEVVFEDATQIHHLTREPLGVIACIARWTFPF